MILLNSQEVTFEKFPYAEVKLVLNNNLVKNGTNVVTFMYESDEDLIKLMFVKRELDHYHNCTEVILEMSFMPYARMDREDSKTCFTLKYISQFINFLNFRCVIIHEAHSDVSLALIDNSIPIELTKWLFYKGIEDSLFEFNKDVDFICYPDATAYKRYSKIDDFNAAIGMKNRDFNTGWINNLEIFVPEEQSNGGVSGKNVIILDDLCSNGGTFTLTAEELKRQGAKSITLIIAHCEPSILDGDVLKTDIIDCVITSNTILKKDSVSSFDKMFVYDFMECNY